MDNKPRILAPVHAFDAFENLLGAFPLYILCYAHCRCGFTLEAQADVKVTSCVALTHCISSFPCHDSSVLEIHLVLVPLLNRKETYYKHCSVRDIIYGIKKTLGYSLPYL